MNEYILFATVQMNMERLWREAERKARLVAAAGDYAPDPESVLSRLTGGRG